MISAADFSGIAQTGRVDLATTNLGSSTTPSTLPLATTSPGELLAAGFATASAATLTPTFPFTTLTPQSATLGTVTRSSYPTWATAPTPATYKATATLTTPAQWTAALVAYKPGP
jgi:hypothetical protein